MKNKKILAITHQMDFSGAPVALYEALKILKVNGFYIDIVSLKNDEGLSDLFVKANIKVIDGHVNFDDYDYVIFNTLLTVKYIPKIKCKAKLIAWIHESPYLAGLAWNAANEIKKISFADAIIFPSLSCRVEWSQYIDTKNAFHFYSPVVIPDKIKELSINQRFSSVKSICVLDPRESYRGIDRLEEFFDKIDYPLDIHFVGAEKEDGKIKSKYVNAYYYGRIVRNEALKILALCDTYISATCMATQNRGLCEALILKKNIYLSSINVHHEIGGNFNISSDNFFFPLQEITMDITSNNLVDYNNINLFTGELFAKNMDNVFKYVEGVL
jgi:hypothetical protein